ncbi:MAG: hypothetical protein LBB53_06680 [Prevotellaceae bacterium]|jgi:hypothetical protein|nr:hypothetical protein [Prevotellaceae bacterium]
MITFGLTVTVILGFCIALSISRNLKLVETLGLAFPFGIGLQTFLMVCLDWLEIRLTATSVIAASAAVIALLCTFLFLKREEIQSWTKENFSFSYPKIGLAWLCVTVVIAAVAVINVAKTMYFPTFDTDSVRGFDLMGIAVAHEGTIKDLSIFTDVNFAYLQQKAGSYMTYTPLSQLAYAYVYMLGAATSKVVNALVFLSFILAFYGVLSRFATHLLTAITTFFMIMTPEMLGFSSMSGTNYIHAVYASLGILYFAAWHYKKIPSFLWISAAMLMCNIWTRNEGLAFIGAACCVLLWQSIKTKNVKNLPVYGFLTVFPFVFWNIFLKINDLHSENVIIFKPFWDSEKISTIIREVWILFNSTTFYGISFILFFFVLLSNIWQIFKKHNHAVTLLLIFLSIIFYTVLVYQVNYLWDSILNVLHYSYKRFLFSFIPLLWFYVAVNFNVKWLFEKIDIFLWGKNKIN